MIEGLELEITVSGLSRHLDKMGLSLKKDAPPKQPKRGDVVKKHE